MNNETNGTKNKKKNGLQLNWVLPVLFAPRKTFQKITAEEKPSWLTPLLILSVLIILAVLVSAPIKQNLLQTSMSTPDNFQYYSSDQQGQFMDAQQTRVSPMVMYILPMLGGLASLWVSWFILSSLLHLSLTLSGSRAKNVSSYNLAGWSYIPIGLRYVVQILAMLISKKVISAPGLSGFIAVDATGFAVFLRAVLALIDIYFIWQVILLFVGAVPLSGLSRAKAWVATALSILILMMLKTIPGLLSHALSGLSSSTSFFF